MDFCAFEFRLRVIKYYREQDFEKGKIYFENQLLSTLIEFYI